MKPTEIFCPRLPIAADDLYEREGKQGKSKVEPRPHDGPILFIRISLHRSHWRAVTGRHLMYIDRNEEVLVLAAPVRSGEHVHPGHLTAVGRSSSNKHSRLGTAAHPYLPDDVALG